jgi:hypothetical protein
MQQYPQIQIIKLFDKLDNVLGLKIIVHIAEKHLKFFI